MLLAGIEKLPDREYATHSETTLLNRVTALSCGLYLDFHAYTYDFNENDSCLLFFFFSLPAGAWPPDLTGELTTLPQAGIEIWSAVANPRGTGVMVPQEVDKICSHLVYQSLNDNMIIITQQQNLDRYFNS